MSLFKEQESITLACLWECTYFKIKDNAHDIIYASTGSRKNGIVFDIKWNQDYYTKLATLN